MTTTRTNKSISLHVLRMIYDDNTYKQEHQFTRIIYDDNTYKQEHQFTRITRTLTNCNVAFLVDVWSHCTYCRSIIIVVVIDIYSYCHASLATLSLAYGHLFM